MSKQSAKTTSTQSAARRFETVTGVLAALARLLRADGSAAPSTGPRPIAVGPASTVVTSRPTAGVACRRRARPGRLRTIFAAAALALLTACLFAPPAQAEFGTELFDVSFENADGTPATQAGAHPFAMNTHLVFDHHFDEATGTYTVDEDLKDVFAQQLAGLAGDSTAYPRCKTADFLTNPGLHESVYSETACDESADAVGAVVSGVKGLLVYSPLLNLEPPPGVPARLGFDAAGVKVILDVGVEQGGQHNLFARQLNLPQIFPIIGAKVQVWGDPADPAHDPIRGRCVANFGTNSTGTLPDIAFEHSGLAEQATCPSANPERPLLTLPTSCTGPAASEIAVGSWLHPGTFLPDGEPDLADPAWATATSLTHDTSVPPNPQGFTGCGKLNFAPSIAAQPTSKAATSPTGLDFSLDVSDPGLQSASGLANSDIKKVEVTLPEGMSANPSLAEGLAVCSEADLARETLASEPGEGCPEASKIGTVEVESPLVDEAIHGALYIAKPYQNPFGSLLAMYIVIKNPNLGVIVKQPAKIESDPLTGRLTNLADEVVQLPFSHFRLHFREGTRSPLSTPPACGAYPVKALLYPWSGNPPVETTSTFQVISGPDNSPCPSGGLPPFHPALTAGTVSNAAGRFSPFNVKLTRTDSEQEITHFSIKLPPGVAGKLAGIPFCSDAAIATATARTGPHGGQEELDNPSCPAASQVGRSLAGSGVGPALAYAPGKVYLAGPYHGHPVSLVAITAGVVGPFDIGTVVVRLALDVNPETGEVFLDSTGSDPIPHIVKGIPVHLRDIRAYTDRPDFVFNPTSCEPTSTSSTVLGSGLDFVSTLDDNPFVATSRFQAADCAALPFKPKLTVQLKGSTKRAGNPALHAHLAMAGMGALGANEAGLAYSRVALPKSLFLDQGHIDTICTRVQFKQGATEGEKCPAGSIIGSAKAVTPILDAPLEGPIYLRSSEHPLPDLVAALHGSEISVVAVGHTDSAPGGGLRNTFDVVPDAPITSVDIDLFGGKKGLIISSRNLCSYKPKAKVEFKGHNGKLANYPKLAIKATGCKKKGKKRSKRHAAR